MEAARDGPAGEALLHWVDECPNDLYSALTYKAGAAWRKHLKKGLRGTLGLNEFLDSYDDDALHSLMTNLAGHDMESVLEAFQAASSEHPTCFVAYTIKGHRMPFAGHKDNHAGLMNERQMAVFKKEMGIDDGEEWSRNSGLNITTEKLDEILDSATFNQKEDRRYTAVKVEVPKYFEIRTDTCGSTQQGFGQLMNELGRSDSELANAIVTTSPDVTVSTNLGGWVNQRGLFDRQGKKDVFREQDVVSIQKWIKSQSGQHVELGIAENNLFLMLAAMGLSEPLFGARLLPVGTLYDPFINRGLDSLIYACYQDARFMVVSTPSGITLAPEGGAHQSINTPLIGMAVDGLVYFEPSFVDELGIIVAWGFQHMQLPIAEGGGSVYLRLSTRPIKQLERKITPKLIEEVTSGAYWIEAPSPDSELAIAFCGVLAEEAIYAHAAVLEDVPGAGLLAVTSPELLHQDWLNTQKGLKETSHVEKLLQPLATDAIILTVLDGHPATLSWLGAVGSYQITSLGIDKYGQSGAINELYREYKIDKDSILEAVARAFMRRLN